MEFVPLHDHTTFSFKDGFQQPEEHVSRITELGISAIALTEHGNVSSHVRLEKAALAAGVKPIFGVEAYTGYVDEERRSRHKWHLTLLAQNAEGYRNLLRIVTESWAPENFYQYPTVGPESLAAHAEGLSVLSGCLGGRLACALLGGKGEPEHRADLAAAKAVAARFRDCFGDSYYLEVQPWPELERECELNRALEKLSGMLRIPLVATVDAHYCRPEDSEMQKLLHASGRGGVTAAQQGELFEYEIPLCYPESDNALWRRLRAAGLSREAAKQAILNSGEIAAKCNVTLPKAQRLRFPMQFEGDTAERILWNWLQAGFGDRGFDNLRGDKRAAYWDRMIHEYNLIRSKDLCDFFLATADMVTWAKNEGIVFGPARGSGAASLALYLLSVTDIDPLKHPMMLLERFLDPDREDLPDVDLDIESRRRDEVRLYLVRKYGADCVGNIASFTRYRGKLALNDVARTYGIPRHEVAPIAELVEVRPDGDERQALSLLDASQFPAAKAVFDRHPDLRAALRLEGNLHSMGVHAAGLVVASEPLSGFVASYTRASGTGAAKRDLQVISADVKDAEHLGAVKWDALGLTTLDVLGKSLRLAGLPLSTLTEIPDDDPAVMAAFARADTVGVFQFDGRSTRSICRAVAPQNFMELADINALSRPGCLASGTTEKYIKAGRRSSEGRKLPEIVAKVLGTTRGQLVYQEQLINTLRFAAGFDWKRANAVRKICAKKIGGGALQEHREAFLQGCSENGISESSSAALWHSMESSASYLFNAAHAISYAKLAVWAMWLKVHHPLAFFCASLRHLPNDKQHEKKFRAMLLDAREHGISIESPDLMNSDETWSFGDTFGPVDYDILLPGFAQIPGIGETTAAAIVEERNRRSFQDWRDLKRVPGIGPKTVEKIAAFAEQDDPFGLDKAAAVVAAIAEAARSGRLRVPVPDCSTEDLLGAARGREHVVWAGLVREREYKDEAELERARTGETREAVLARLKSPKLVSSAVIKCYGEASTEEVFVRVSRWDFPRLARAVAQCEPGDAIVVLGKPSRGMSAAVRAEKIWVIEP